MKRLITNKIIILDFGVNVHLLISLNDGKYVLPDMDCFVPKVDVPL